MTIDCSRIKETADRAQLNVPCDPALGPAAVWGGHGEGLAGSGQGQGLGLRDLLTQFRKGVSEHTRLTHTGLSPSWEDRHFLRQVAGVCRNNRQHSVGELAGARSMEPGAVSGTQTCTTEPWPAHREATLTQTLRHPQYHLSLTHPTSKTHLTHCRFSRHNGEQRKPCQVLKETI